MARIHQGWEDYKIEKKKLSHRPVKYLAIYLYINLIRSFDFLYFYFLLEIHKIEKKTCAPTCKIFIAIVYCKMHPLQIK